MAVIAFFTKRDLPSASCAPMLAASGMAAMGFRIVSRFHGPGVVPRLWIMSQSLPGVDAISTSRPQERPGQANMPPPQDVEHTIVDFDLELWAGGRGDATYDVAVLAGDQLRAAQIDPLTARRSWFLPCSRVWSERPLQGSPPPFRTAAACVPVLTPADVSSLYAGAPLPRPRGAAHAVAVVVMEALATIGAGETAVSAAP